MQCLILVVEKIVNLHSTYDENCGGVQQSPLSHNRFVPVI